MGLRILFTGQSRVRERRVTSLLALAVARNGRIETDIPSSDSELERLAERPEIKEVALAGRSTCIESILTRGGQEIEVFLDSRTPQVQNAEWRNAFKRIIDAAEQKPERHVFASMHAVYYRKTRFFSLVDFDLVRQFRPDLIVTLTDDAQSIWNRIRMRTQESPAKTHYRLSELLTWRTTELLFSDTLAQQVVKSDFSLSHRVKNYMLAVKHPVTMLYRLLFAPEVLRVYASFHISAVRGAPSAQMHERRGEINDFRAELHKKYVVFDPVTVDEKIVELAEREDDGGIELPLPGLDLRDSRWDLRYDYPLAADEDGLYPLRLTRADIEDATQKAPDRNKSPIDDHIRYRDFRLVEQSDCIAAYRPHMDQKPSTGMTDELTHAQVIGIPTFGYSPDIDQTGNPFGDLLTSSASTVDELFGILERQQKRKNEAIRGNTA